MKKILSVNLDEKILNHIKIFANQQNISMSQMVELACINLLKKNNINYEKKTIDIKEKQVKSNKVDITLNIDNQTFKLLINEINKKNTTFTQEILYRLSASLNSPIFNSFEFNELRRLWIDLNRLGNLIKMAINQKIPFDNELLLKTNEKIKLLEEEIFNILKQSKKRTFKGGIK